MNSRTKGKRGELEAAAFLTVNGIPARRGCQFSGSPDSPDIVSDYLRGVHFEVKRTQRTDLEAWLAQAEHDAGTKLPIVLHRKNRGPWIAVLRAEHLLALLRETNAARAGGASQNHTEKTPCPTT